MSKSRVMDERVATFAKSYEQGKRSLTRGSDIEGGQALIKTALCGLLAAADMGNVQAMYNIGMMYTQLADDEALKTHMQLGDIDYDLQSLIWLTIAAKLGHADSVAKLVDWDVDPATIDQNPNIPPQAVHTINTFVSHINAHHGISFFQAPAFLSQPEIALLMEMTPDIADEIAAGIAFVADHPGVIPPVALPTEAAAGPAPALPDHHTATPAPTYHAGGTPSHFAPTPPDMHLSGHYLAHHHGAPDC